jgi:hypothetical protein
MLFSLEKRKKLTHNIIFFLNNIISKLINNKILAAFLIMLIHTAFVIVSISTLIICKINKLFYLNLILITLIICGNLYFNGCILVKLERELLKPCKNWYGPTTVLYQILLKNININMTDNLAKNIQISHMILLGLIAFLRILYSINDE